MSNTKKGVIIGVDPHKMSATIEVVDTHDSYSVAVGSTPPTPAMPPCAVM